MRHPWQSQGYSDLSGDPVFPAYFSFTVLSTVKVPGPV